ncbi:sulfurtransferase TusA family protein [Thermoproteus tenax]|uniref:Predicted redox protein, regulator of disulfide bond formation n=1 Tax=Thermoproteus tenax (strain ATCC 35583 / DSM 2078 / JCM 9277 / NBRC 100435 / Kra 1) TaxID=768679 RepID=G4RND5_THETK|nr:sulfurtransferase TusA family protein [Thermoproteus tenax]CCC81079.1 predicted redox protein, regulator of disulfide bond formation [Thermoproteus tenax Kra 1]
MQAVRAGERYVLDLRGYVCPYPQLATLRALRSIEPGAVLEILTDNPPSCENVPSVVKREGHEVLAVEEVERGVWRIVVRKR